MSRSIQDVEGIGPKYAEILRQQGIDTTDKLLHVGGSRAGRVELAEKTSINESRILKWVNMCDLFRIKGVAGQFAELLEGAGVDTVKELRNRNALIKHAHKLPRELYKSLTWDRGSEMADHQRFTLDTDIKVYFCDPQSPWQRGSNEQINGLLRQYFPKGMDLSNVHQNRLNAVARQLNERPRKTLGYYSPAEKFAECVAATD